MILIIFTYLFLTTQTGFNLFVDLAKKCLPGSFQLEKAEGKLWGDIHLHHLDYEYKQVKISMNDFTFTWHPASLFRFHLDIDEIYINRLKIHLPKMKSANAFHFNGFNLPIKITVRDFTLNKFYFKEGHKKPFKIKSALFSLETEKNTVHLKNFSFMSDPYVLQTRGFFTVNTPFSSSLIGELIYSQSKFKAININFKIKGDNKDFVTNIRVASPFKAELLGHIKDWSTYGPVDISAKWNELLLPINEEHTLSSHAGGVEVHGTLSHYQVNAEGDFTGTHFPKTQLKLVGQGDHTGINSFQLLANLAEGTVTGKGKIGWDLAINWQASVYAHHLNPAAVGEYWPGKVDFTVNTNGDLTPNKNKMKIELKEIKGQINHYPLLGSGLIQKNQDQWLVKKVVFSSGNNTLNVAGHVDEHSLLIWDIRLNDLSQLFKDSNGFVKSHGVFTGSLAQPIINTTASIKDVHFKNNALAALDANVYFDFSKLSHVAIHATGLSLDGRLIKQIHVNAQGNIYSHQMVSTIYTNNNKLSIKLKGAYSSKNDSWAGSLQQLTLTANTFGDWNLNRPINILVDKTMVVSPFCWMSSRGSICGNANLMNQNNWMLAFSMKHLNLAMIQDFLPQAFKVSTEINGAAKFSKHKRELATGNFNFQVNHADITFPIKKVPTTIQLVKSHVQGTLTQKGVEAKLYLQDVKNQIPLSATLQILADHGDNLPTSTSAIKGAMSVNWRTIAFAGPFIDWTKNMDGQLNAKLAMSGTVSTPVLKGEFNISHAILSLPQYGLNLKNIAIKGVMTGSKNVDISGQANSGSGILYFKGSTVPTEGFSPTVLNVTGQHILVYDKHNYVIFATPVITFNYTEPKLQFTGTINIPEAHIAPKDFTTTVELPENVEIVGTEVPTALLPLYYNLRILLGNNVTFNYAGINTALAGEAVINKVPGAPITAVGDLRAINGFYTAYGQSLKIDVGDLLFTGGPIENPNINVLATKSIQTTQLSDAGPGLSNKIVVGVRVTGTMNTSKITFYSMPTMPASDVLAYLVFGQDSGSLSDSKVQALSTAAQGAGVPGLSFISTLKNHLQLNQFGFESDQVYNPQTQTMQQNTSLVLGKNITKNLSASYSIGILIPVNILRLRYMLSKHWSLQSDASAYGSGGDIVYTIHTD